MLRIGFTLKTQVFASEAVLLVKLQAYASEAVFLRKIFTLILPKLVICEKLLDEVNTCS
jgi:hypothetical protein